MPHGKSDTAKYEAIRHVLWKKAIHGSIEKVIEGTRYRKRGPRLHRKSDTRPVVPQKLFDGMPYQKSDTRQRDVPLSKSDGIRQ